MSLKYKLIILVSTILVISILSVSYIIINKSTNSLIQAEFRKLEILESAKHGEIKKYFNSIKELLISMSNDITTKNAMINFENSFHTLKDELKFNLEKLKQDIKLHYATKYINFVNYAVENSSGKHPINYYIPKDLNALYAQHIFIIKNPAQINHKNSFTYSKEFDSNYLKFHKLYHNNFNNYLKQFGLYDIFLVDLKGNVVYTVFKEKDFGTNLLNGPYKNSGLGIIFKKAINLKHDKIIFEDFKPYEPSYNTPAAFVATPIFKDDKKIGILIFQIPTKTINKILHFNYEYKHAGLGDTGECYLVGSDFIARSDLRFINKIKDPIVQKLKTTIGVYKIKTFATKSIFAQNSKLRQQTIYKNYLEYDVLGVYHKVNIFNQVNWAIIAEISKNEAIKPAKELSQFLLIITIILILLFILLMYILVSKLIISPLEKFFNNSFLFFDYLKGKTKHIKTIPIISNDEIGLMAQKFNDAMKDITYNLKQKEINHQIEDLINKLNEELLILNNLDEISKKILTFCLSITKADSGSIYIYHDNVLQKKFSLGQKDNFDDKYGIFSTILETKQSKMLSNINQNIQTSLIDIKPSFIYIYPLIFNNNIIGIIEIAKINRFSKKDILFLDKSASHIAITIYSALSNEKVNNLLKETEKINKELKIKQKELENINISLEEERQKLEEANTSMEEYQQQLELQNEDLKIAQKEIEEKIEEIKKANEYKSQFLANVSHELRTPLNSIILLSELLLKNKNLSNDDIKKAKTINTSGKELLRLINDILDLSKVESGKIDIEITKFSSEELLDEIYNLFYLVAKEKNIDFIIEDNYKGYINNDKYKISQIIKNLVSNGIKFTKEGFVKVTLNDNSDNIKIIVKDTGIGIPKNKIDEVFKEFVQADSSTTRKYGGTGLGLSIVKKFTQLLSGQIDVKSILNKGSEFILTIPKNLSNKKEIENEYIDIKIEEPLMLDIIDDRATTNSGLLLINDDINSSSNIIHKVHHKQFNIFLAKKQDEINDFKDKNIIGIIIILEFNQNQGTDILKYIKTIDKYKNTPIILISKDNLDELDNFLDSFEQEEIQFDFIDKNILIVDDDIKNIFTLDGLLREYNTNVFNAFNGEEALEVIKDNNIDLILLDIMMPVMDGFETLKIIRQDLNLSIPIIIISAKNLEEDKEKAISLGANDYLIKPIDSNILIKIINAWLNQ